MNADLALVASTIYPDRFAKPLREGVVLVKDATISTVGTKSGLQIPADVRTLDCSGCTIVAGLWNSHVHFFERKWADAGAMPAAELRLQLESFTRYGFTDVFDLSSLWENTRCLRARIESGEVVGPAIRSTGEGIAAVGALPPKAVLNTLGLMETPLHEVADRDQADQAAQKLLAAGVDGIKLFLSSPNAKALDAPTIAAAVECAHRRAKPVFAHPNDGSDVLAALQGGVDIVAHTTPHSGAWDRAILAQISKRKPALVPTLMLWKETMRHDRISAQRKIVETALDQLRAWRDCGGDVLFGTDFGAVGAFPGDEYALMARAGMGFREILGSLTTAPAERFGFANERGRVSVGFRADLAVLQGDPDENLFALTSVRYTLRDGNVIYRAA